METENRKFTILSFFIFSALVGYVFYLILSGFADWLKFGGSNVAFGLSWPVLGGLIASVLGFALFIGLATNQKATNFIDDVFTELAKTTWPTMKETGASTVVVSIMVAFAAFILFSMDFVWHLVFQWVL